MATRNPDGTWALSDADCADVAVASGWIPDTVDARAEYLARGDDDPVEEPAPPVHNPTPPPDPAAVARVAVLRQILDALDTLPAESRPTVARWVASTVAIEENPRHPEIMEPPDVVDPVHRLVTTGGAPRDSWKWNASPLFLCVRNDTLPVEVELRGRGLAGMVVSWRLPVEEADHLAACLLTAAVVARREQEKAL